MPILSFFTTLSGIGIILWLINTHLPPTIKKIANTIIIIVVIFWLSL